MGQPLGAVGNDMSALAIQSGLAATKVQQLNSAWDEFLGNVTGGTNAFSGFVLAVQGLGITALKSTASMQGTVSSIDLHKRAATGATTATTGLANSLTAAGQKGAQTWQQFNAAITGPGQQMLDWFRTARAVYEQLQDAEGMGRSGRPFDERPPEDCRSDDNQDGQHGGCCIEAR